MQYAGSATSWLWRICRVLTLLLCTSEPLMAASPAQVIDIGSRRELMVDAYLIDQLSGSARQQLHHPVRREIAITHDAPWEGNGGNYHTVFEDDGLYRMYYHAWQIPVPGTEAHPLYIAYAESPDGIHWIKPDLGIVAIDGWKDNTVIHDKIKGAACHDHRPI